MHCAVSSRSPRSRKTIDKNLHGVATGNTKLLEEFVRKTIQPELCEWKRKDCLLSSVALVGQLYSSHSSQFCNFCASSSALFGRVKCIIFTCHLHLPPCQFLI